MKNYLLTMLFVSALTGGVVYLSTGSRYEKHLRYLCTLLTLLSLLSPLPTLFSSLESSSFPEITTPENLSSEYGVRLKNQTAQRLDEELTYTVSKKCELGEEEFTIACHIDLDQEQSLLTLSSITVRLHTLPATLKREQIKDELLSVCPVIRFIEELSPKNTEEKNDC